MLGDLTASNRALPYALEWVKARPGHKHLVLGNHDPAHPMHSDSHKWELMYYEAFDSVAAARTLSKITLPGGTVERVLMSHFPYHGDRTEYMDRHTQFRLRDEGMPLLHGHIHTRNRVTHTDDGTPQIHVGQDAWDFTPASLEQVTDLLLDSVGYRFPVTVTRMARRYHHADEAYGAGGVGMAVTVFDGDEGAYQGWLAAQGGRGYVINIFRSLNLKDSKLHCSDCGSISDSTTPYVTGDYVKVCADRLDELDEWSVREVGSKIDRCRLSSCFGW